jgi:hypothetical protein
LFFIKKSLGLNKTLKISLEVLNQVYTLFNDTSLIPIDLLTILIGIRIVKFFMDLFK